MFPQNTQVIIGMKVITGKHNHVFLILILISAVFQLTSPLQNFSIAKSNCTDHCGNIGIPYPFGMNENCYHNYNFLVTCNETFDPPKPFMRVSDIEITNISIDGQFTVLQYITETCYSNGLQLPGRTQELALLAFTVSNTANRFVILGCDTYGYISGSRLDNRHYQTGCGVWCAGKDDLMEGSCLGLGCCQSIIPEKVWEVDLTLISQNNYRNVSGYNCSYAFVVEETAFHFHPDNLTNFKSVQHLPMVLEWGIENVTCEVAKSNSTSYACTGPNTECYDPTNGYGYRCQCSTGYIGNPYLDGCQDINECLDWNLNKCSFPEECKNTLGGFKCVCSAGYHNDGIHTQNCVRGESFSKKLVTGIVLGVILPLLVSCILYMELKRRKSIKLKSRLYIQNGGILLEEELNRGEASSRRAKIYSSIELEKATNNFHNSMIIGKGGFGIVYKGILEDNTIIAVKKSKQVDPTQIEQFINEVFILCQVNHRNIVELLGCCLETPAPLLVYEYVSNGTLFEHIHDERKRSFLDWNMRLKIATETANVLSYLHSAASTPIIHRDIKSANILLDHEFVAKVSDFGASRLVPLDQTQLCTMVQGTFGYLDPEYMQTNQLNEKSDVYSFGVVLVELLTAKKVLSYGRPKEDTNLANFFLRMLKQNHIFNVLDDIIVCDGNKEILIEVCRLAQACLSMKGEDRPIMKQVAMELEGMKPRGRHSWQQDEVNMEERKSCLCENPNGYDGYSSVSAGYSSSLNDNSALLSMSGGR